MTTPVSRLATTLSVAVVMLLGLPGLAAADDTDSRPGAGRASASEPPARILPRRATGHGAIRALGPSLARVARSNDLPASRLTSILQTDDTAWLSSEGRLFYQEEGPAQTTGGTTAPTYVAPKYSAAQTWALHSNPAATRKIFLDFDGATVQNTAWNRPGTGQITNGTHIGFDTDGSPGTFSPSELGFIQEVWREVSESYSPFEVDVTTADPGLAGLTRASSSDTTYGTRVVITSSPTPRTQVCGGCLGVAFVATFDAISSSAFYQPAWVFAYDRSFDPMIIAQAVTHEAGHTLGLQHDGTATTGYYGGTSAWGPIMGSSRDRALSQFSAGEYAGANNREDDFTIIGSHGLPYRADDHGSSVAQATALGAKASYDVSGIIGNRQDTDVFKITLPCVSDLSVSAAGIGAQTTLDLKLEVLDAAGLPVLTSAPRATRKGSPAVSGGMDAQTKVPSATGVYYLRVDGVGDGNPASAGTGWSDYGSVGQYHLSASGCPGAPNTNHGTTGSTGSTGSTGTTGTTGTTGSTKATPATATQPGAPVIRTGSSGTRGGSATAIARWSPPVSTGGAPITKYRVRAQKLDHRNHVIRTYGSAYLKPTAHSLKMRLSKGRYVFAVTAYSSAGRSSWSRTSHGVYAR